MAFSFFKKNKALVFKLESGSLSLLKIEKVAKSFNVVGVYYESLPASSMDQNGNINDIKSLAATVRKILKQAGFLKEDSFQTVDNAEINKYELGVLLSERHIYSNVFESKIDNSSKIDDKIIDICATNLPISKDDLIYQYSILDNKSDKQDNKSDILKNQKIYIVATENHFIKTIRTIFADQGIIINNFISSSSGLASSSYPVEKVEAKPKLIVDFSADDMSVSLFGEGRQIYSRSVLFGFNDMERKILKELNYPLDKMRNFILSFGLTDLNKKETHFVVSSLDDFISHVKETVDFIKNKKGIDVEDIILSGYASVIPGMTEYVGVNLNKKAIALNSPFWITGDKNEIARRLYASMVGAGLILLDKSNLLMPIIKVEKYFRQAVKSGMMGRIEYYTGLNFESSKSKRDAESKQDFNPNNKKTVEQIVSGDQVPIDIKSYKKLLSIILVGGLSLVVLAYGVRLVINRSSPRQNLVSEVRQFAYTTDVGVDLVVAIEPSQFTPERVRGRSIQVSVKQQSNYLQTQKLAQTDATALLTTGEKIWESPILSAQANENPAKFTFLVFNNNEALSMAESHIKSRVVAGDYKILDSKIIDVQSTENPAIYILKLSLTVNSSALIDTKDTNKDAEVIASGSLQVPKSDTEKLASDSVSFTDQISNDNTSARINSNGAPVNLRSSPNLNSNILLKLQDGQIVDVIKKINDWIFVLSEGGDEGWIKEDLLIIGLN